jgi:hypothetical protein
MKVAFAFALLAAMLASGCGSEDSATPPATTSGASLSAENVEKAFRAEVAGGGVVNLDDTSRKSIVCVESDKVQEWSCTISPTGGGEGHVCIITVDPATRTVTERTCGRIDN